MRYSRMRCSLGLFPGNIHVDQTEQETILDIWDNYYDFLYQSTFGSYWKGNVAAKEGYVIFSFICQKSYKDSGALNGNFTCLARQFKHWLKCKLRGFDSRTNTNVFL